MMGFEKYQDKVVEVLKQERSMTLSNLSQITTARNVCTIEKFRERVIQPLVEAGKVSIHQTRPNSFLVCIETEGEGL